MIYKLIGRIVVTAVKTLILYRYGRQLRVGLGFGVVALLLGGYLAASRNVSEG